MKKNTLSFLILISGVLISGGIFGFSYAQTATSIDQTQEQKNFNDIKYPISELGNCTSKSDCKVFCDNTENIDACLSFAEKSNLMSSEEISNAKKFQDKGMVGPGSCNGKVECEKYCSDSANIEECTAFAEKNGLMSDEQLRDSKKVVAAIKSGLKPPACGGPAKCQAYCSNPLHMEECMTFSLAAGIVPENQKIQMQKTLDVIKQGIKPPACQPKPPSDQPEQPEQTETISGLPSCDEYCGTNQEECMTFSIATGMVPDDQKEQMQKTLDAFKQGIKPPACRPNPPKEFGEQSNKSDRSEKFGNDLQPCEEYCADSSHVEECVKFSVAIGNMTEEQGQNSMKNGGKGPGGCTGKDSCNTFCSNPDNEETCFNFAKDNGMISEEDLQKIQNDIPGQGGSMKPEKNQNQQDQSENKFQPRSGNINPGDQVMPQQAGPGGCKGQEECQKYCVSNPEVCKNFQPQENQSEQSGQRQPTQQQNQAGQINQDVTNVGACGTGPGTCSGIGPDDINSNNEKNDGEWQFNQLDQQSQQSDQQQFSQPDQQSQMQFEQQQEQQNPLSSTPSGLLFKVQNLLANVLSVFW